MTPITLAWDDDRGTRVRIKVYGGSLQVVIGAAEVCDHVPDPEPSPPETVVEMDATEGLAARVVRFFETVQVPVKWKVREDGLWFDFPDHKVTPDAIDAMRGIMGPVKFGYTCNPDGHPALGGTEGDSDGGEA